MKILSVFKSRKNNQFVSEIDFITDLDRQSHQAIETLVKLREFKIEEADEFKSATFFTPTIQKKRRN